MFVAVCMPPQAGLRVILPRQARPATTGMDTMSLMEKWKFDGKFHRVKILIIYCT